MIVKMSQLPLEIYDGDVVFDSDDEVDGDHDSVDDSDDMYLGSLMYSLSLLPRITTELPLCILLVSTRLPKAIMCLY